MRILSDSVATKQDLDAVDAKQNRQIRGLTYWLLALSITNLIGFIVLSVK